jgi:hypothetical protein
MRGVTSQAFTALERVMQERTPLFSHQLVVTLAAKIRVDCLEKTVLVGPVALVASDTVSESNGGVHVGLRKLVFEIVVAGITELVGAIEENARDVGAVWIVAFDACPLLEGVMQRRQLVRRLFRLLVARETQGATGGGEKVLVGCAMG